MNEAALTVFVVDDDPGSRRSIGGLLEEAGIATRFFASGVAFLAQWTCDDRGCVILDLRMPEIDGLSVVERLAAQGCALPIIIVTGHGDIRTCARAFKMGVFDFLEKPLDGQELLECVRRAFALAAQTAGAAETQDVLRAVSRLTARQREVLELLVAGKTLKQIAGTYQVSVQSVWKQQQRILDALGVENHVQLARLVLMAGRDAS